MNCLAPTAAMAITGATLGYAVPLVADYRLASRFLRFDQFTGETARKILRFSWATSASQGTALLARRFSLLFVFTTLGATTSAALVAAQSFAEQSIGMAFMVIAMIAQPLAVRAQSISIIALRQQLDTNALWFILITVPCAFGLTAIANDLAILVGPEMRPYMASIIPWLAFGALFNGFRSHYVAHSFFLAHRNHYHLYASLVALLANLALLPPLIHSFALPGALAGSLLAEVVALTTALWLSRSATPITIPLLPLTKTVVASAAMAIAISLITLSHPIAALVVKIITGVAIYAGAAYILNINNAREVIENYMKRTNT